MQRYCISTLSLKKHERNGATTMQYLSKITNSHSCGHDNISSSTLKCIAHEICECLTLIIIQSITKGIFPEI